MVTAPEKRIREEISSRIVNSFGKAGETACPTLLVSRLSSSNNFKLKSVETSLDTARMSAYATLNQALQEAQQPDSPQY